jgi:hypothetical protein
MIKSKHRELAEHNPLPNDPWEEAYLRFESPEEEIRKFIGRLKFMGATKWPRNAKIVELFCGRGSGLRALHQLGFSEVEGIDLSRTPGRERSWSGIAGSSHLKMPAKISLLSRAACITCLCSPMISIEYLMKERVS